MWSASAVEDVRVMSRKERGRRDRFIRTSAETVTIIHPSAANFPDQNSHVLESNGGFRLFTSRVTSRKERGRRDRVIRTSAETVTIIHPSGRELSRSEFPCFRE